MPYTDPDIAYVTAAEIAAYLGFATDEATLEAVGAVRDAVQAALDTYCGIASGGFKGDDEASSKLFDGSGHDLLKLNHRLLRSIESVETVGWDGVVTSDMSTSVVGKPIDPPQGVFLWLATRERSAAFPAGDANIKVTGLWGFATVPPQVKLALKHAVKAVFDLTGVNSAVVSDTAVDRSIRYALSQDQQALTPLVRSLLGSLTFNDMEM